MKRDPAVSRALAMDLWESSRDSVSPEGGRESPNQALFGTAGQTDQRMETDGEPQGQSPSGPRAASVRRFASLSTIGEDVDAADLGALQEPGFPGVRFSPPNVRARREDEQPLWEDGSSREVRSSTPLAARSHLPHPYVVRTGRYRSPGVSVGSTPGLRSDRPSETVDVVHAMTAGMKDVVDSLMEKFKEIQGPGDEDGVVRAGAEKFQAISHMDFKATAPTIKDDNPDLDAHDRLFDVMIENYAHGSRKPRAIDTLYKYAFSFKEGSTRRKVYEKRSQNSDQTKEAPEGSSRGPCRNKGGIAQLHLGDPHPEDDKAGRKVH